MQEYVGKQTGQNLHLAVFTPEEVLKYLGTTSIKMSWQVGDRTYWVDMSSQRYHVFAKSLVCSSCGLVGTVMALDIQPFSNMESVARGVAHFNLYGVKDGELILMTKDHIVPVSKGGFKRLSNLQTMCSLCNCAKGDN